MTLPIISVENLGKSYLVGHERAGRESYTALRDVLSRNVKNFGRKALDLARGRQIIQGDEIEEFWALKDVSFELHPGEAVGIVGRNGAGKSTLLKVLSRITEPTCGRVTLRGRVASLLEVGTGFHPELTGRENVFLNGAVLGMTRIEIKRKFDEIVEFAGVERFLDTPVKRYSSGMYVRLAFSVAAHLEPEVLVIDEVLAVGDVKFQEKCLGKMRDVANAGQTLLFVSHNLASVRQLCERSVLLDSGQVRMYGPTSDVLHEYLHMQQPVFSNDRCTYVPDDGKAVQLIESFVGHSDAVPRRTFSCDDDIFIFMNVVVRRVIPGLYGYCELSLGDGTVVAELDSNDSGSNPLDGLAVGEHRLAFRIPSRVLGHGEYRVLIAFASPFDEARDDPGIVATFQLDDETTLRGNRRRGVLSVITHWALANPVHVSS